MTGEMAPIRRPFAPADLRPSLAAQGIERVVLVQTCPSLEETRDFLALAATKELVAGVVGWVDLSALDVADTLAELRELPGGRALVAARHQVHDEPDPEWLLRSDVQRGLRAVAEAGLAYDLLVRTAELPAALAAARALPELRFVVDHAAKPPVRTGELEPWAARLAPLAELENVFCKVSGLVTEADWQRWTPEDFVPYVSRVAEWFGGDRLLFGSDWPVCLLAGSYDDVVRVFEHTLGALPRFAGNAEAAYELSWSRQDERGS
jgi:L-fucono-1,5-lactonase